MNKKRSLLPIICLLATSVAMCAFNPQSYLSGNPQTKTDPHLYPVQIVGIDGAKPHDNPVAVTPGPHWLEIQAVAGDSLGPKRIPKSHTYVFRIEPCTRYFFGAHKDSAVQDNWKLVVDQVEAVKGCDPAEELKKYPDPSQAAPRTSPAH
jgi:hypothetical protein